MPVVTHLVSLTQPAGVEAHFSELVRHARVSDPNFAHGWLNAAREMHPFIADRVAGELAHMIDAKHRFGLPLPAKPAALRTWHCRRELAAAGTDVLVIWNRTAKAKFVDDEVDLVVARRGDDDVAVLEAGLLQRGQARTRRR